MKFKTGPDGVAPEEYDMMTDEAKDVIKTLDWFLQSVLNAPEILFTSLYRPDSVTHSEYRAFDCRTIDPYTSKPRYTPAQTEMVRAYLKYKYGDKVQFVSRKHGTAEHWHVGVNKWYVGNGRFWR